MNREQIKLRPITLIEEKLVPNTLNDNVPGIDRPGSAHEGGEDSVGGENGGFILIGEPPNNRVIGGGDFEEVAVFEPLEAAFIFGGDSIVGAIVVLEGAAEKKIFGFWDGEGELGEGGEGDLVVHVPLRLDIHRGFENRGFAARVVRV